MLYLDSFYKLSGHQEKDEYVSFLERTIKEIADIIYMEMPLRFQDEWLNSVIQDELYNPEDD